MADTADITFHDTPEAVTAMWRSLIENGGYSLQVDANGTLHALKYNAQVTS